MQVAAAWSGGPAVLGACGKRCHWAGILEPGPVAQTVQALTALPLDDGVPAPGVLGLRLAFATTQPLEVHP